jgi:hypothetical protein
MISVTTGRGSPAPGPGLTAAEFADLLARTVYNARSRLNFRSEAEMQQAVADLLAEERLGAVSQPRLGPLDRPDFMIGTLLVELKRDGSAAALERQLRRYAVHDEVGGIVVVTNRARHRVIPREISGKPVRVAWISGAAG